MTPLERYRTWLLDCDGVILDSNRLKSEVFYTVALPYGEGPARVLLEYHRTHGGISRFRKFRYFFEEILHWRDFDGELQEILTRYGQAVYDGMIWAAETPRLREFLGSLPREAMKFVISGGSESELQDIFKKRDLDRFFDGIYGSPRDKVQIVDEKVEAGEVQFPAVFVGDSRYDFEVARRFSLDFIFMRDYTEFPGWEAFFREQPDVEIIGNLGDLLPTAGDTASGGSAG